MTDPKSAASAEIVELHVLLQNWFCGQGANDPRALLEHFTPDFRMVGAAGRPIGRDAFADVLPSLYGSRPGLVMKIHDVNIQASVGNSLLATYREEQTQGDTRTERWSGVLLVPDSTGEKLLWNYLQETFLP